jgi:ketosteroid isomerase-like protein
LRPQELVQRWVDALNGADTSRFVELWDPACEFFSVTGSQVDASGYRGHDGLWRYREEAAEMWRELRFELERVVEGTDGAVVVAIGRLRAVGRTSGAVVEQRIGLVYELRGGKIHRCRSYPDPSDALAAAGMSA